MYKIAKKHRVDGSAHGRLELIVFGYPPIRCPFAVVLRQISLKHAEIYPSVLFRMEGTGGVP